MKGGNAIKKRNIKFILLAVVLLLSALILITYPIISNYTSEKYAAQVRSEYSSEVEKLDDSEIREELRKAHDYNKMLSQGVYESFTNEQLTEANAEYDSILNISGAGLMAYVDIPAINVHLPVYHSTSAEVLEKGLGHVIGTSLPVGGESTHAVVSGHSGMAGNKMLSDLDKLKKGDVFYVTALNEKLAYTVTQIDTVLPSDTSLLTINDGEDLVTLVTCTPFGVNTHRLLVRGTRTDYTENSHEGLDYDLGELDPVKSTWMEEYYHGLKTGFTVVCCLALLCYLFRLSKRIGKNEKKN